MALSHVEMLEAEKQIRPLPSWQPVDLSGRIRWRAPLSIGGATIEGLFLHGRSIANEAGRDVSFTLEHSPAGRLGGSIDRIDWKPSMPHSNKGIGPEEFRFKIISGSHRHRLYDNLTMDGKLRTGNLPIAIPIEPDPQTFEKFIDFVAKTYKVDGLSSLLPPPWIEDLFG